MRESTYNNMYRTTLICIDEYKNEVLSGRMYNPYFDKGIRFQSTMELLKKMDSVLDEMNFPQSFSANRVFCPVRETDTVEPPMASPRTGRLATFAVKVLFRQNASWQGSIVWSEGRREESFRSVLELLFLMDSVLGDAEKGIATKGLTEKGVE